LTGWRSSAAYRIALLNFAAFAAGLALLGIIVFVVIHISFTRQLDASIADEAQTLTSEYRSGGDRELGEAIAEREQAGSPARLLYAVFLPDGRRIHGSLQAKRPKLGFQPIEFIDPLEGRDMARGFGVDVSPNERLLVAADGDWIERIDHTVIGVFLAAFAAACALGFFGAAILGRYLRGRLQSIRSAADAIIAGHARRRMPVSSRGDEFDELAMTLNRMLNRIEGLMENLRQVSSDVAHDLRTPLARLRGRLEEGLERPSTDAGSTARLIEDSIEQVDDVLALFGAILRIAEVESGETRRFFAPVNVSELATELAESYAPAIADEGRTLLWSIEPGLTVEGDRELLAQALVNLIENAQSHTPPGTLIRLTAIRAGEHVCLQVMDDGPGVPEPDLVRIARRFTRLDTSRNRKGFGLGLNLVRAAARLHQGHLRLSNANPGLIAIIDLPRLETPKPESDSSGTAGP
jgi:signal transduction histidine kinase